MRVESPSAPMFTGYALFDGSNRLVDANAEIFGASHSRPDASDMDGDRATARIIAQFKSFDGHPIGADMERASEAAAQWRQRGGLPVEAETPDGSWRLFSSHPRVEGGLALVSTDITDMKRAQLAHLENAEIFRCITDSHPLPVWVVDEENRKILYESLDASKLLGRKWQPNQPQYLTDHYVRPEEFDEIRALAGANDIVRDREIELRRADGSTAWCSANFRSTFYRSRPALVIGVLDITERKGREDLLGFLIKHHPLPVWMNEVGSGEIIYQSEAAERLFGCRNSTGGKAPRLADCFVDKQHYLAIGRELMREGVVENCEALLRGADGQEIWVTGNLSLVEFQGRQVVLGGIADVTKQKQRDEEVASAREMLANAIESLSEGFALYDEDHRLIMCNSHYRQMHKAVGDMFRPGVAWTELLAEGARRGAYPEAIGREAEWLDERIQSRVHFVHHYEFSAGEGIWHSVSVHPTQLGGFVVTRADISERKKAEASERDATALLQKVLDACPSPTYMSTLDGQTLYRNPASRELYGERPQITDYYLNPRDSETLVGLVTDGGRVDDFRVRQYAADGRIFWASISARLIDFQGRRVIVSNTTDVNDVILAQEQTRQANERLTDAIESLSEGFALYDKDDRLVLANRQYRRMHAVSADVLVPGVNWFDFLRITAERNQFPVPREKIDDWLADRARDRREFRQQEFQHSDGDWFFVSNCPTREGGFVVTRVDITERKRAQLAAEEAGELVRRVLEACPVNIQMTRAADGKLLYRSPAAAELHGDVASALDYYVNSDDRNYYVERLLKDGTVDDFETQLWRRNGETCWCSISSRLIDFHGEKVIVSHTYDLTDRLEMQRELERQRERLHQNEKLSALGGLLAGVAHELNNPLSVVLGLSLMLKETTSDAKTAERAAKIGKAAERCARIVRTFLAMARQQPAQTSNVDMDDVIASAIEVAGYSIQSSDIELSVQIDPGLPPIWADPDQLSQVLINLLVNAEQALHDWEGPRKVKVQAERLPAGGKIAVKVTDTGPGISADIQSRIFDPFFTTKEVGTGTGIGLSFCHRIVQSHGGTIEVESVEGEGSTFTITLPASNRTETASEVVKAELPKSPGLSCLVVDDEKEVSAIIGEVLACDGFSVTIANSGEQALTQLKQREFGLVLCDLKMPNMDGRRLFHHIAELHPAMVDKLAFLTGDTVSPDAQAFLRATGRPYYEKPIKPYELRAFVSALIKKDA